MSGWSVPSVVLLLFSLTSPWQGVEGGVWDLELCKTRESHWRFGQHGYIYSGQSQLLRSEEKSSVLTGDKEANLTAVTRDWAGAGDIGQLFGRLGDIGADQDQQLCGGKIGRKMLGYVHFVKLQ